MICNITAMQCNMRVLGDAITKSASIEANLLSLEAVRMIYMMYCIIINFVHLHIATLSMSLSEALPQRLDTRETEQDNWVSPCTCRYMYTYRTFRYRTFSSRGNWVTRLSGF